MALRQVHFLLSGVLGNVAMGLPHGDIQLRTKPQEQFLPHDAHEGSVSRGVTLALLEVLCGDDALVELLVAILAESDQIIRGISSGLPAFPVMHMELDVVLFRRMGAAALAGVAIPPEDVLPDVILSKHFALLVVLALRDGFAFLHCLDKLEVKLSGLNDHFRHGEQIANPLDCRNVFLNLDLHRGCEPTLVLAVYPVVEPRLTIPCFAISPCSAELPAGREVVHHMTVDQAKMVKIDFGKFSGWTLGDIAMKSPGDLAWYVKNYSGHNLALKAGAIKLLEAAGQMAS